MTITTSMRDTISKWRGGSSGSGAHLTFKLRGPEVASAVGPAATVAAPTATYHAVVSFKEADCFDLSDDCTDRDLLKAVFCMLRDASKNDSVGFKTEDQAQQMAKPEELHTAFTAMHETLKSIHTDLIAVKTKVGA